MTAVSAAAQKSVRVDLSPLHYVRVIVHRKWRVLATFMLVSVATAVVAYRLPNIYMSETVILVDPQKVPENYVKATVTGDVRGRLGTLTQQILSATRLQKIIETYGLYPEDRKKLAREDVINRMRNDISVQMVTGGSQQSLEAFRVAYSGRDPRLVAQVANQLAALFIDENLKAREQQATDTTDFLHQQLEQTRKTLETQEAQLRDFRLKHVGEMPEHQVANLTVLGQLQASLQQEGESLSRAEQQRAYIQSMMSQSTPIIDVDADSDSPSGPTTVKQPVKGGTPVNPIAADKARLATLLTRYTDSHPEVQKLKAQIADAEAKQRLVEPVAKETETVAASDPAPAPAPVRRRPVASSNPVLVSQLKTIEAEIEKHKQEQERLGKLVASYRGKLEAVPIREQQIAELVRDYEINKTHYTQLLDKQLSAETATQLEIRQKGEQFSVLDPAQPAQRPSSPKRALIDLAGCIAGLLLGCLLAIAPEFVGTTITSLEHVPLLNGNRVLEIIPVISTEATIQRKKRRFVLATASSVAATILIGVALLYRLG